MTDAEKALDGIVTAYCMSLGMDPPIPDLLSQTAEQVKLIRTKLAKSAKVDGLLEALRFYADPASYQFIHGTASYMPIEVDDGYKAKEAIQRFNGEV